MDATHRPLESPPASPDSATLPTSSLTPGPAEIREGESATATCPDCDGSRYVDNNAASLSCPTCSGRGAVCPWQHDSDESIALRDDGTCRGCLSTPEHRTAWAAREAWTAAYDPATWEGLARRNAEQAERLRVELSDARGKAIRAENECAMLRSELANAKADLRAAMAKAQLKIEADHAEHLREVEDLKRQLRRQRVPMTADQIERDDGEVAA